MLSRACESSFNTLFLHVAQALKGADNSLKWIKDAAAEYKLEVLYSHLWRNLKIYKKNKIKMCFVLQILLCKFFIRYPISFHKVVTNLPWVLVNTTSKHTN